VGLRIVPASEIHADTIAEEETAANASPDETITIGGDGVEFELVGENGEIMMRSNRETIDDSARQTLTMEEIEALKRDGTDAGKELIAKLMLSHTALDQKTAFSLAKYKLLKTKKYLRRFTILPLDVSLLTQWLIEDKDPGRIMEMREELLALAGCWGNVHFSDDERGSDAGNPGGRYLVVDEVGGLLVAAMAERMGILNLQDEEDESLGTKPSEDSVSKPQPNGHRHPTNELDPGLATTNTITLIHSNSQPNLSLLKYFSFNPDAPPAVPAHPLTTHLKSLSWLQLLSPQDDTAYSTPPPSATPDQIASWKSGKRSTYYRKRRRYARTRAIVDETRAGGFDGLIVASYMDPIGIMRACVPLLRGGAQVAIYSPTVEPLAGLADLYSMSRRTAFITSPPEELGSSEDADAQMDGEGTGKGKIDPSAWQGNDDFPLNPTLLLGVTVQTSKVRKWQVLPGRTHPLMTGRGGAEGYLFTAVRVIPAEGRVAARGKFSTKRRKVDGGAVEIKGEVTEARKTDGAEKAGAVRLQARGEVSVEAVTG
jgi:tRNA (adenine58-N1)-methyltransferase non-catalytic subunit